MTTHASNDLVIVPSDVDVWLAMSIVIVTESIIIQLECAMAELVDMTLSVGWIRVRIEWHSSRCTDAVVEIEIVEGDRRFSTS